MRIFCDNGKARFPFFFGGDKDFTVFLIDDEAGDRGVAIDF